MKKTSSVAKGILRLVLLLWVLAFAACGTENKKEESVGGSATESVAESEQESVIAEESENSEESEPAEAYTVDTEKTLKMYYDVDKYTHEMTITRFKEYENVPYVEAEEFFSKALLLFSEILDSKGMSLSYKQEGAVFTAERENGATFAVDAEAEQFTISSFFDFLKAAGSRDAEMVYDYGDKLKNVGEEVCLVARGKTSYVVKSQANIKIDLTPYNIDLIYYAEKVYLPFQLMSNFLLSQAYQTYVCFDEAMFLTPEMCGSAEYSELYNKQTVTVTEALLEYNYYETCFVFDQLYGLKDAKDITGFDELFVANGLKENALSSVRGYNEMLDFALSRIVDDGHTVFVAAGPLDNEYEKLSYGASLNKIRTDGRVYRTDRKNILGSNIAPYTEIGNTAFITLDVFSEPDFYAYSLDLTKAPENGDNTVYVCAYAYKQITRQNSPIKNVVVDISCNGGGDTRSLVYALGMFMDEVVFCFETTLDGALLFSGYYSDCNLDHVIDEKDKLLLDKNIFVIESSYSYSCANVFANTMGQAGHIMLGKCSGGGSCAVAYMQSSLGTVYQLSGEMCFLKYKNGLYESNDCGCEVDYSLTTDQMYNRAELKKYLETLVKSK